MKKTILALLSIIPLLSIAQYNKNDYKVSTSSAYKVIDAKHKFYFSKGNDVMMVKVNKKNIIIQKYDSDRKQELSRKEYPALPPKAVLENIVEVKNNHYLFYSLRNKSNKSIQLYCVPIDFDKGTLGSEKKLFHTKDELADLFTPIFTYKFKAGRHKFDIYTSFNKENLFIKYRKKPKTKDTRKNSDVFGAYIYNYKLEEKWNREIIMPYTEFQMNNLDFAVDKQGNAYFLTEVNNLNPQGKNTLEQEKHHLELFKIEKEDVQTIKFEKDDLNIISAWLIESENGKIYLAGYYNSEQGYQVNADGLFLYSTTANGNKNYKTYEIPSDIINIYESEKVQNKNAEKEKNDKLDFEDLVLDKIMYMDDGSVLLIGEQYYTDIRHMSTPERNYIECTYYYCHLLATKINANGELQWMKKIPKRQSGGNPIGNMSYKYIQKNGEHYFFFLDHIENIDLDVISKKRPKYHIDGKGGIFTAVKINDATGEMSKSAVVDMIEIPYVENEEPISAYQFKVSRIIETDNGLVFETYKKGKKDIMIHIDF